MKCNSYILVSPELSTKEFNQRVGANRNWYKPKDVRIVASWWHVDVLKGVTQPEMEAHGFQRCGGDLTATVEAGEVPIMGGISAELRINMMCTSCSDSYNYMMSPEFDSGSSYNNWLNRALTQHLENIDYAQMTEAMITDRAEQERKQAAAVKLHEEREAARKSKTKK